MLNIFLHANMGHPSLIETHEEVVKAAEELLNTCYGTDNRHRLAAIALADKLVDGIPIPWKLSQHFGRL